MKCLSGFFALCLGCSSLFSIELIKQEKHKDMIFEKIKFDDHTYIRFGGKYNSHERSIWHDPKCEECHKVLLQIIEGK